MLFYLFFSTFPKRFGASELRKLIDKPSGSDWSCKRSPDIWVTLFLLKPSLPEFFSEMTLTLAQNCDVHSTNFQVTGFNGILIVNPRFLIFSIGQDTSAGGDSQSEMTDDL